MTAGGPVVVAYDVGTSGVKAVVVDRDGHVRGSTIRSYGIDTPQPGWVEQDIESMVLALGAASRDLLERLAIDPSDVASVGLTAQMFSVVPVDGTGKPLRPMLSWLDQRASSEAGDLRARAGADAGFAAFDAVLTAKDIVPRIAWLAAHERSHERAAWYLDCKEAILARLTGSIAIDPCGASAFRLVDPLDGGWDAARCDLAGVPIDRLPPILPAEAVAGHLSNEAAALTGLRSGTPVVTGAGDVPAGQIGAGASRPGAAHLSLGTAVYFGIVVDHHVVDPAANLGPLRDVVPGRWILWLETATGGGALAWLNRQLAALAGEDRPRDYAGMDAAVKAVEDEMDGLLFAPWLSGERVPLFDDAVRAAFVGLGLHHGAAHLTRAVLEGVACQVATTFEYGLAYGVDPGAIRAVGGGGIGAAWTVIVAETLGRPLEIVAEPQDAAARGAAACALVGAGLKGDVASAVPVAVTRTIDPDPSRVAAARDRLARFRALYPLLRAEPSSDGRVRVPTQSNRSAVLELGPVAEASRVAG